VLPTVSSARARDRGEGTPSGRGVGAACARSIATSVFAHNMTAASLSARRTGSPPVSRANATTAHASRAWSASSPGLEHAEAALRANHEVPDVGAVFFADLLGSQDGAGVRHEEPLRAHPAPEPGVPGRELEARTARRDRPVGEPPGRAGVGEDARPRGQVFRSCVRRERARERDAPRGGRQAHGSTRHADDLTRSGGTAGRSGRAPRASRASRGSGSKDRAGRPARRRARS
jgi:hypothetical protein